MFSIYDSFIREAILNAFRIWFMINIWSCRPSWRCIRLMFSAFEYKVINKRIVIVLIVNFTAMINYNLQQNVDLKSLHAIFLTFYLIDSNSNKHFQMRSNELVNKIKMIIKKSFIDRVFDFFFHFFFFYYYYSFFCNGNSRSICQRQTKTWLLPLQRFVKGKNKRENNRTFITHSIWLVPMLLRFDSCKKKQTFGKKKKCFFKFFISENFHYFHYVIMRLMWQLNIYFVATRITGHSVRSTHVW